MKWDRSRKKMWGFFVAIVVLLAIFLRFEKRGSHDVIRLGAVFVEIDHSGFPGDFEEVRVFSNSKELWVGNGRFSVGFGIRVGP